MSASLELEHGGGFSKSQRAMLKNAEELCRQINHGGRPLIEETNAQVRLARTAANLMVSDMLTVPRPVGERGEEAELRLRTDGEDVLVGEIPERCARSARPHGALVAGGPRGPAGALNMAYRHSQGTTIYAAPAKSIAA